MKAKWIARAMMAGQDHLLLTLEELAEWQSNGCKVGLGAPYNQFGQYVVAQYFKWHQNLQQQLIGMAPEQWPVGAHKATDSRKSIDIEMPALEFDQQADGRWKVPLVPMDKNHCLDSWSYDIYLTPEELASLRPIAEQLLTSSRP